MNQRPEAHLLIIDDNPADRELTARELLRSDPTIRITHITNDRELHGALERNDHDLAITDYELRWTNGIEVLRMIKARDASKPVIMFTGSGSEEVAVKAMKEGLDDYITKTVKHFPRIPIAVAANLERVRQRHELARQQRLLQETTRTAAERVRVSEERFRAVQETSPDGFTVLDAVRDAAGAIVDFRIAYMNDAAARVAKAPREALIGRRVLEIHPGNREAGLFDRYVHVVTSGESWVGEVDYNQDSIVAFVRLAVAKVGDGVAISTVDVSERKRAEDALREADRQKDEFLAMLAHELRNPLAPIRNGGELLARMMGDDARAGPVIDIIRRQVAHLTRLVDDLLDVSRITRRRIELKQDVVDLATVVAQAVETVEPLMRSRNHHLRVTSDAPHLFVRGDLARLVQCIVNLLNNAAKFTDPGGEILVETRRRDERGFIEVSDNGIGISAALQPKIFTLFVQSDQTLDRAQGGLGIGLSVVQQLIEMHGGSVAVHSDGPGKGSRFCVELPLIDPPKQAPRTDTRAKLRATRFLIVDDNVDAAETIAFMLRAEGHDTRTVHQARDVLRAVNNFRPEYVLLDIGLPGMDGYAVAQEIRRLPRGDQPRLIALTGYGQPEDRKRALDAGFDEHFVKPVDVDQMLRQLAH
jgi:two-component system CheB/CheR fusion protein